MAAGLAEDYNISSGIDKIKKMKHGGRGEFQGRSHEQGGIRFGDVEVEGGEKFWVMSKAKSQLYVDVMDKVFDGINSGKITASNGDKVVNNITLNDKYTRKMYESIENEKNRDETEKYVILRHKNRTIKILK